MGKIKKYVKSLSLMILLGVLFLVKTDVEAAKSTDESKKSAKTDGYTIMVYMVGSNLESDNGCASMDLLEMMDSGIDTSKNNVVVYTGGTVEWKVDIPSGNNCILELQKDKSFEIVKQYDDLSNMGEAGTLTKFIDYCYKNYDTSHYALVLWDHGAGPLFGFGVDEMYDNDTLTMPETKQALQDSVLGKKNKKLDWVGYDACLMASIEIADVWKDYANYMVASQELEPGTGWNYAFLKQLNKTQDAEKIAECITQKYKEGVEEKISDMYLPDMTLSCLDLGEVDNVIAATDSLFSKMEKGLDNGKFPVLLRNRGKAKGFAQVAAASTEKGNSYDMVDMQDMADKLGKSYSKEAKKLAKQIEKMVVCQESNVAGTCGVSMYYPYQGENIYTYYGKDMYEDISVSDKCTSYMKKYTNLWINGDSANQVTMSRESVTQKKEEVQLQLSDEQAASMKNVTYTILSKRDGVYQPLVVNCKLTVDKNNIVHLPLDQDVFLLKTDETEGVLLSVEQVEKRSKQEKYTAVNLGLTVSSEYLLGMNQAVDLDLNVEGDSVTVGKIRADVDDMLQLGKREIDYTKYNQFIVTAEGRTATYDANNQIQPYQQWDKDGAIYAGWIVYEEDVYIEKTPIASLNGDYVCQITFEDINGNISASDLIELPGSTEQTTTSQNTSSGTMEFAVYKDHAEFTGYTGNDTELKLPDTVSGQAVTKIASYAMKDNESVTKVELPSKLKSIGSAAFANSNIEEIEIPDSVTGLGILAFAQCSNLKNVEIPASVTKIGNGAFAECGKISKFVLEKGNKKYKVKDGVLFTKDMKQLVEYPAGGKNKYKIPKSVKVVKDYAFIGMHDLTSVTIPDSVTDIGIQAFYDCRKLTDIDLSDKLQSIGHGAFAISGLSEVDEETGKLVHPQKDVKSVYFGNALSSLGERVFDNVSIEAYKVSGKNKYYSSKDGMLMNKAGDILLACPVQTEEVLEIPEGITVVADNALNGCSDTITELILPDSLTVMKANQGNFDKLQKVSIGSNLMNEDGLRQFYNVENLTISEENPYFLVEDQVVYSKDRKKLLLYSGTKKDTSFSVPEGVEYIRSYAFGDAQGLESLTLPSSFVAVYEAEYGTGEVVDTVIADMGSMSDLKDISVAEASNYYYSENGLLYDKGQKTLLYCPTKKNAVEVKSGVEEIGSRAFASPEAGTYVIPEGVKVIQAGNFDNELYGDEVAHIYLPESLEIISASSMQKGWAFGDGKSELYRPIEKLTVHVKSGSKAEEIAKSRGMNISYE